MLSAHADDPAFVAHALNPPATGPPGSGMSTRCMSSTGQGALIPPIVLPSRDVPGLDADHAHDDDRESGRWATERLLNLGRRPIAAVGSFPGITCIDTRLAGNRDALEIRDVPFDELPLPRHAVSPAPGDPNRIPIPSNCLTPRRQRQRLAPLPVWLLCAVDTCMPEAPG